ncbi:hypothetical protein LIER_06187 [Lithospermum erythrorhizon]|uniref:Uncharacterized protein n=1 Tax=Lithospermum erythrorhizon TaxID=34254 RepID=A0AAV3P3M6_LITER
MELLLQKSSLGSCIMPHKVNFIAITTGKDPLAQISKRKGKSASEPSLETLSAALPPKKSKKVPKISAPVVDLPPAEVSTEVSEPRLPSLLDPVTIILSNRVASEEAPAIECAYGLSLKWRESEESELSLNLIRLVWRNGWPRSSKRETRPELRLPLKNLSNDLGTLRLGWALLNSSRP